MLISDTSPWVKGWPSAGFDSQGAFVLPSWFRGQKLNPALPCQDSAEFCVLQVVHKPKAWSWDTHQAFQRQETFQSPSLPRQNEPPGTQSSSTEKGTDTTTQVWCKGNLRIARLRSLRDSRHSANRPLWVMSPKQTRKLHVSHCSHTPVTQTSKLIAESLNALTG